MLRALPITLVLAAFSLTFAALAHAVLITVSFTVTGSPEDPVNAGVTANGSFTFDSRIIPEGAGTVSSPVTSGFHLIWEGTAWDDTNTAVGTLTFDEFGSLTGFYAGGDPAGWHDVEYGPVSPDDFSLNAVIGNTHTNFTYFNEGNSGYYYNGFTWTVSLPEPASWHLLGLSLVGLVGMRGKRRSPGRSDP